ncbi:S8 family serine peptidase [Lapillicoccus jejuensis]|uniref:Subtilase family protein n=1 Tax=Lapillicoccus jejuensis TaxID=402171 RepID=A0A542DXS8_9MICO|nr:S8 family serine peptidase [Lapillicoccus jejuensis]TQJ07891.1 subtilase family protein [Lapillicoccus jejuensis]
MPRPLPRRPRRRLALLATALVTTAATLVGATGAASATAGPAAPTAVQSSTPVPIDTPDGQLSAYVVLATQAGPADMATVRTAVRKAGGVVVQAWPQIGVVVAHSDRAAFRTQVVALGAGTVSGAQPTRTVAVSEGTPDGITTPWSSTAALAKAARVTKASPAGGAALAAAPVTDPRESEQWDMRMIKADKAHEITDGSPEVVVGVLDSGIDASHPDLAPNIDAADSVNCTDAGRPDTSATGWLPTTSLHGTHVAGTIAAARNGVGIVGVAPGVKLASVKVVNDDGFIYPEYAVCGFMWAGQHKLDVTNNSYYVDPFEFYCGDQPEQAVPMEAVRRAVAWSTSQGVVHAAAAGNSAVDLANKTTDAGSPDDGTPVERTLNPTCKDIPAELDGVATVSALSQVGTTLEGTLASYSNRGLGVIDVAAPGSRILSTVPGGGYALLSGTSMASPHVAGVLALLKSVHPTWSPAQLLATLDAQADAQACTATPGGPSCLGRTADNSYYGNGKVDANQAVRQ